MRPRRASHEPPAHDWFQWTPTLRALIVAAAAALTAAGSIVGFVIGVNL